MILTDMMQKLHTIYYNEQWAVWNV